MFKDIAFGPKNMGLDGDVLDERVREAAGFAGVDESLLNASPLELSGGQITADGTPKEVFSQVEQMKKNGLTVPETTELLYGLNESGFDLPLTALSVDECADAIANYLKKD